MDLSAITEPFKNFYYKLEDKWYDFLDYLSNYVPVYKVIDPIDSVVPSFVVFLLVILFLIVLGAYLMQFGSNYEIEFHTVDSKTSADLSDVTIYGEINAANFDEVTDAEGMAIVRLDSGSKNLFDQIGEMIFGAEPVEFYAIVSAEKAGYNSIADKEVDISTKRATISMVKKDSTGPNDPIHLEDDYPNSTRVTLVDSLTDDPIVDNTGSAYVRFNCANKATGAKTAKDIDDGDLDGVFLLNSEKCQFVVTNAYTTGYESPTNLPRTLPTAISEHKISMSKIRSAPGGTIKVYAYEKNSSPEKPIPRVQVTLLDKYNINAGRKLTDNSGVAVFTDIDSGTYTIIAASPDSNYASIRVDENVSITAVAGATREKKVYLERIDPTLVRFVKVQLKDSNTLSIIRDAKAFVQEIRRSGSTYSLAPLAGCLNECISDSNGIIKVTGLMNDDANKVLMIVNKPGYVIKIFKPILVKSIDPPTVEYLEEINSTNSGQARVTVKSSSNNALIAGAKSFLYVNLLDPRVQRVQIFEDGILTNSEGISIFNGLPIGADKNYVARATYDTLDSGYSAGKQIYAGQTTDFNLSIALDAAFIRVLLLDANTRQVIPTRADANVVLFPANRPMDVLHYDSQTTRFISAMYPRAISFVVAADLNNYAGAVLEIPAGNLSNGINDFNVRLYPLSMLDKNVNIFFNGFYRNNYELIRGIKANSIETTNQHDDGTFGYYEQIDVVAGKDLNYSDLFGAIRFSDAMKIVGIPFKTGINYLESGYYLCSPPIQNPVNSDEFYIQTDSNCQRNETNPNGAMAGIHWQQGISAQRGLKKTVYTMAVKTIFGDVNEGTILNLKGFGKEKHNTLSSEDRFDISYQLGTPIGPTDNNAAISIIATMNSGAITRDPEGFIYNPAKKTYLEVSPTQTKITAYQRNNLGIKVRNDSNVPITNIKLYVYTYSGIMEEFNYVPSGAIRLDNETTGLRSRYVATILNLNKNAISSPQTVPLYSLTPNSTTKVIIVAAVEDKNYLFVADTKTVALNLVLSGARFMADVQDQNFDAEVFAGNGRTPVALESVDLKAVRNCSNTQNRVVDYNNLLADIDPVRTNYFERTIPGIYRKDADCLVVHVVAESPDYDDLTKTIYAGYSVLQDLTLSCVDASFPDAFGDSDLEEMTAEWDSEFDVRVINTCAGPMQISVESGLNQVSNTCNNLASLAECNVRLKARNKSYSPTVKYSDILGVFPIYIKARDAQTSKKLALADKLKIHISNSAECFQIIQKDIYEANPQPFKGSMIINNNCQNTLVDDYYVPKEVLSLAGADVNTFAPKYQSVDFNYDLIVRGGGYDYGTTPVTRIANVFFPEQGVNGKPVIGTGPNGYNKYGQFRFSIPNYSGQTDLFYFRWSDRNDGSNRYGAVLDNTITVNYRDGTHQTVQTNVATFDINTLPIACKCYGTRYSGASCSQAVHTDVIFGNGTFSGEHCMLISNDLVVGVPDGEGIGGLMYVYVPRGNVESFDFNIYGNPNATNLRIKGYSWIRYTENLTTITPNGSSSAAVLNSGGFRIYPVEGYTYILKNLADTSLSKQLEERIQLCKKVQSADAWYFLDQLYWTKRSIMNFDEAKAFCSTSAGAGIDLTGTTPRLATSADVSAPRNQFISGDPKLLWNASDGQGGWVNGEGVKGFWLDNCQGEWCFPLRKLDTAYAYVDNNVHADIAEYVPLCTVELDNTREVTSAMCTALGITCNKASGQCVFPDPSSFTSFNSNAYLKTPNPLVEVVIKSVRANGRALDPSTVVVWLEGGLLKARFIGENYSPYDDQTIESDIIAKDVKGDQYGTLTVIDYVNNPED